MDRFELPTSGVQRSGALSNWATSSHYESHVDAILVYTIANSS